MCINWSSILRSKYSKIQLSTSCLLGIGLENMNPVTDCSTMMQQRLTDLATIALESGLLEKIEYEHIIEEFISRNTKRMKLFK